MFIILAKIYISSALGISSTLTVPKSLIMFIQLLISLLLASNATRLTHAQIQAPAIAGAGKPISRGDRIYTGDQTSNTITVIDPSQEKVLGTIATGEIRLTDDFNPQYVKSVNAHGLGFSRDGKFIISLSTLSNMATVIRTADNVIVSQTYVDRGAHESFFSPDNRTAWIGTRGVSTVDVIDGLEGRLIDRIETAEGPSKVLFSPNGTTAYVNHIFAPVVSVIDVAAKTVEYNITGLASSFSSDFMLSADGGSLWVAHKKTGQVSVIDLAQRKVITVLETGAETNHPNFAIINGTTHAFVTVASLNQTKVYSQPLPQDTPVLVKSIDMTGIEPHGIWPSPDNSRIYVVNEHSDTVDVIDTASLAIIDTLRVGQEGQSVIYVAEAVPEGSNGTQNLGRQGLDLRTANKIVPVPNGTESESAVNATSPQPDTGPQALVTIRQTSGLDMFQIIGRNLRLNRTYTASALCESCSGESERSSLVTFKASTESPSGCGTAPQVLAFFKWFGVYDLETIEVVEGG